MKFEVGEIAVIREAIPSAHIRPGLEKYCGEDVEIMTFFRHITAYRVRHADGREFTCSEPALRKKRPPEEVGSWEKLRELGWTPPARETEPA